ncbi:MAG: hypothetical protein NTY83_02430 [Candidatus Micrarchaeota archaeon]|nr:hypothetical protein [Candidatus Micrarchaeota archaeon]
MADQKEGPKKGFAFIPPPTPEQIAERKQAKTLLMRIGPVKTPNEGSAAPKTTAPGPIRSLKKTQLSLPIIAPPAHKQEKIDFTEAWASLGLTTKPKEEKKEETPEVEEVFDRLLGFRRGMHPKNVEMIDFVILQMEAEFRSLIKSERLQPICSGGRAFLGAEKPVAESISKIRDEVFRRFENEPRLEPFLQHFVDVVLSSTPIRESEGEAETEMRNGFYRAAAWCLCAHNSHDQFVSYLSKNHLSLIDGVGIAAGLSTADSISADFSREMIAMLLERKWVSLAFYHLQDMMRKDLAEITRMEKKGENTEEIMGRLYGSMDIFLVVFFREVENYQTLGQKYTHLAMLLSNLSKKGGSDVPVMYIASSEFYSLIATRQFDSKLWEDIGHTHNFIAERMADSEDGKRHYVVGLRPRDIAQRFSTILEAMDFLTSDARIRDLALKMVSDFYAPFSQDPERNEAFKKVASITLFTNKEDLQRHAGLFASLCDFRDPIISLRASEHREMLMRKKKAAHVSIDPFEGIGDDTPF